VIVNLVVNARDAMPQGGRVRIETANAEYRDNCPDDLAPGAYVLLDVVDTGVGIAREHLDRVFEPFFTTKDTGRGSGLGLSMVYGFVKQSGGHVRIESELGRGTKVRIHLPGSPSGEVAARDSTPAAHDRADAPPARPGETVLLVDDDESVRRVGVAVLADLGYCVVEAADAHAALRILDHPESPRIDLLLTDVVLPGGMDGRQLAEEIRRRRPAIKVLYMTGYTRNAIIHHGRLDPDIDLLTKPFTADALARKIRRVLEGNGAAKAAKES
jgi:CheY-like chemotaxis protein/anti-sigma regulatory factor (Ser/Thr protein kinase)